jgi:hypothetical protein
MLMALLAGWFAEPQQTFNQRWPVAMPSAMTLQMFNAARKAVERPTGRLGYCYPHECLNG